MTSNFTVTNTTIHDYFDQLTAWVNGGTRHSHWEQELLLPARMGSGAITRMRIRSGMEIIISDLIYEQDTKISIPEASPIFESNYCISGDIYCEWNKREIQTNGKTGHICFFRIWRSDGRIF